MTGVGWARQDKATAPNCKYNFRPKSAVRLMRFSVNRQGTERARTCVYVCFFIENVPLNSSAPFLYDQEHRLCYTISMFLRPRKIRFC